MKRSIWLVALFSIVFLTVSVGWAQIGPGPYQGAKSASDHRCVNDANGDGLCDICGQPIGANRNPDKGGKGNGPGDGSGNQGQGPRDGSGYGAGSGRGSGDCDGTGPHGNRGGRGRGGRGGRR